VDYASSSFHPDKSIWRKMWSSKVSPKILVFWWKVLNNAVASKENLWVRLKKGSPTCPRCSNELESIEYLLFRCEFAKQVWSHFPAWPSFGLAKISATLIWFNDCAGSSNFSTSGLDTLMVVSWSIWKARNKLIFEEVVTPVIRCVDEAKSLLDNRKPSNNLTSPFQSNFRSCSLERIQARNFDAVGGDNALYPSASAAVSFSPSGELRSVVASPGFYSSVLVSEMEAIRMGCNLINRYPDCSLPTVVVSDSATAIEIISSDLEPPWEVSVIVKDIKNHKAFKDILFLHISRDWNCFADAIATRCIRSDLAW
jgi:hypothetical protein